MSVRSEQKIAESRKRQRYVLDPTPEQCGHMGGERQSISKSNNPLSCNQKKRQRRGQRSRDLGVDLAGADERGGGQSDAQLTIWRAVSRSTST